LVSHALLDHLPHWDYPFPGVRNFKSTKNFKALFIDLLKIAADGTFACLVLIFLVAKTNQEKNWIFILWGIFFAILPDILLFFGQIIGPKTFSQKARNFHYRFFHRREKEEKEGKITFLGLATEIFIVILSILVFFF